MHVDIFPAVAVNIVVLDRPITLLNIQGIMEVGTADLTVYYRPGPCGTDTRGKDFFLHKSDKWTELHHHPNHSCRPLPKEVPLTGMVDDFGLKLPAWSIHSLLFHRNTTSGFCVCRSDRLYESTMYSHNRDLQLWTGTFGMSPNDAFGKAQFFGQFQGAFHYECGTPSISQLPGLPVG